MSNIRQTIRINGLKSGLVLGLIITALYIFYFYFLVDIAESAITLAMGQVAFSYMLPFFAITYLCFWFRQKIGGHWNFRQATTGIFIMFLSAYVVYLLGFGLVFSKFIEPNNVQKTETATVHKKIEILKKNGTDPKVIQGVIADLKKDFASKENTSAVKSIQGIIEYIILIFVLALIFAALFKREPPGMVSNA
jgi:hypothetical protein